METLIEIFGQGKDLSPLQMSLRSICIFFICLLLIRLSGRRSFGMHMPLDNVITILLGAVLSRAVVGASPFFSTIAACTAIVILHRLFAWLGVYSDFFGKIVKGEPKIVYDNGNLIEETMKNCTVSRKDIMEGVRINSNLNSLEDVKTIYVERDGQISVVKKEEL